MLRAHRGTSLAVAVLVTCICAPVLVDRRYDSYPLSTYPMFAGDRDRVVAVYTAVAMDRGRVVRLSPEIIGGTSEPMLAAENVVNAVREGRASSLCDEVADRAGQSSIDGTIEVLVEHYDTDRWFEGDHSTRSREVHARCAIQ